MYGLLLGGGVEAGLEEHDRRCAAQIDAEPVSRDASCPIRGRDSLRISTVELERDRTRRRGGRVYAARSVFMSSTLAVSLRANAAIESLTLLSRRAQIFKPEFDERGAHARVLSDYLLLALL